jgi:hypothetical protein
MSSQRQRNWRSVPLPNAAQRRERLWEPDSNNWLGTAGMAEEANANYGRMDRDNGDSGCLHLDSCSFVRMARQTAVSRIDQQPPHSHTARSYEGHCRSGQCCLLQCSM